jgi:hypothetical protein
MLNAVKFLPAVNGLTFNIIKFLKAVNGLRSTELNFDFNDAQLCLLAPSRYNRKIV